MLKIVDMQALAIHYKVNANDLDYNQFVIDLQYILLSLNIYLNFIFII